MRLIKYSVLISLFIVMSVVLPHYVQPVVEPVAPIVEEVAEVAIAAYPGPAPTVVPIPTANPYPAPTEEYPPPKPA